MCVFNWNAVYPTISYRSVSLDSNHRPQMLRVSGISPQAFSGSLADVAGSCAGSPGLPLALLCGFAVEVMLGLLRPPRYHFLLTAPGFCEALFCASPSCNLWMNLLQRQKRAILSGCVNDQLNHYLSYSGKSKVLQYL